MEVEISVIICTYNREQYIYRTLERVARNGFPGERFEIVLVNNNSTDGTEAECRRFRDAYPRVNCRYCVEGKQGLSHARNRGIREARGEVLVFLDDDAFVEEDYLQRLADYLRRYPEASAFGGKITPLFEEGTVPRWLGKWSYIWVSAIDKGDKVCEFRGKSYPIGANMGVRREAVPAGGFNTALGRSKGNLMGGEEKELFQRLRAAGGRIYYFPAIGVRHLIPASRTTRDYIRRLAQGVGSSERLRATGISRAAYLRSLCLEGAKWGATLLLWAGYLLKGAPHKGNMLVYFRFFVTQGLFTR